MYWKQPITTEVLELDPVTEIIITRILLRARNEDMKYPAYFIHGNQNVQYILKRGQSIFKISELVEIGISRRRIEASLKLLSEPNCTFTCTFTRKPFGLIVTILNYDSLTKFDDFVHSLVQSGVHSLVQSPVHTSNKNDIERQERNKNVEEVLPAKNEKFFWTKEQVLSNALFPQARHRQFPLLDDSEIDFCLDLAIQTEKTKGKSFLFNNALNWLEKANENKSKQTKQSKDPNLLTF